MKKILLGIAILLLIIPMGCSKEPGQPLQLTIKSYKEVYAVGKEIIIQAELKNVSDKSVNAGDYLNWNDTRRFFFKNESGAECSLTYIGPLDIMTPDQFLPNRSYRYWNQPIVLLKDKESKWELYKFELLKGRDYSFVGKQTIYLKDLGLTSNTITIEVVAKLISKREPIKYPESERTEEMQYEIVMSFAVPLKFLATNEEVEQREGDPDEAIKESRIYLKEYPNGKHAATVQYFIAFIYQYHKKDYTQAIKEFDKLIQNYPEDETRVAMAHSEKARLLNEIRQVSDVYKGMTKEELYKVFSDLQQEQEEYRKEGDEEWITFSGVTKESEDATIFHLVGGKVEGWEPAPR